MARSTRDAKRQQDSIGADGKALTDAELRARTLNFLTVSGGYISTERDDLGNIMLHENPNDRGSNKQLVNQYISIDVERRDYDDDEIRKVYDTEITELFKSLKTKSVDELRAEIERMRQLLADAEAEITVEEVTIVQNDGSGDGDGGDGGDGDGGGPTGIEEYVSSERMAPFIIEVNGNTYDVDTGIWNTDTVRLDPNQINVPSVRINYRIFRNHDLGKTYAEFRTSVANPEMWQGWYFDTENLGNTQNYASTGTNGIVTLVVDEDRPQNRNDEAPNTYRVVAAFKDEAPPVETTDIITIQTQQFDAFNDEFIGGRDEKEVTFRYELTDSAGDEVKLGADTNAFTLNVIPGQNLQLTIVQAAQIFAQTPIEGWWLIGDDNSKTEILSGIGGQWNNVLNITIPSDIKGILLAYDLT